MNPVSRFFRRFMDAISSARTIFSRRWTWTLCRSTISGGFRATATSPGLTWKTAPHPTAAMDWNRRVVTLALPIILANLALPILAMVDTTVAGHLSGPQHLGGVALGGILFSFLFWSFGFLRMATTGLAAQAYGANDHVELRKHLLRALLIATLSGVVIVCLQWPIISAGITLMGGSGAVQHSAADYAYARIWSSPASLGNFVVLGYLLGSQRVSLALVLQIGMNILNLAATLLLAIGLNWGVAGIGAGTAVAEWATFLTALLFVKPFKGMNPGVLGAILNRAAFVRLFRVNIDIFLRSFFLLVSFGWFTRAGAAEGDVVLAANAVSDEPAQLHGLWPRWIRACDGSAGRLGHRLQGPDGIAQRDQGCGHLVAGSGAAVLTVLLVGGRCDRQPADRPAGNQGNGSQVFALCRHPSNRVICRLSPRRCFHRGTANPRIAQQHVPVDCGVSRGCLSAAGFIGKPWALDRDDRVHVVSRRRARKLSRPHIASLVPGRPDRVRVVDYEWVRMPAAVRLDQMRMIDGEV